MTGLDALLRALRTVPFMDDTRGFALPGIVLGLALLSLIASTGFLVSWLEVRGSGAFVAGTRAFFAADGGLATGLAATAVPPSMTGSVGLGVEGATFTYWPLIGVEPGEWLYVVRSRGWTDLAGTRITREVERVAWFSDAPRPVAALLARGPVDASRAAGEISGFDLGSCGATSVPGLATWSGAVTGPGLVVRGVPAQVSLPAGTSLASLTGIRWGDLAAGLTVPASATVPPDPWPTSGPAWSQVRLAHPGPLGPAESGRGALVALGDLILADGFGWDGLVLVGGDLLITGAVSVRGGVLAGLDPATVSRVDLGAGNVSILFDSCSAEGAAAAIAPLAAGKPGTWRERW